MKHKKKIIAIISAFVIVTLTCMVVYAFLSDSSERDNSIKSGNVVISVDENGDEDNSIEKFDENNRLTLSDRMANKPVRAENNGNLDCYVRVWLGLKDETLHNSIKFSNSQAAEQPNSNYMTLLQFQTSLSNSSGDNVWKYDDSIDGEGWFYYTTPITPGEYSAYLFQQVKAETDIDDDFGIIVYMESVQTNDDSGAEYSDYLTAWKDYLGIDE